MKGRTVHPPQSKCDPTTKVTDIILIAFVHFTKSIESHVPDEKSARFIALGKVNVPSQADASGHVLAS